MIINLQMLNFSTAFKNLNITMLDPESIHVCYEIIQDDPLIQIYYIGVLSQNISVIIQLKPLIILLYFAMFHFLRHWNHISILSVKYHGILAVLDGQCILMFFKVLILPVIILIYDSINTV